MNNRKDDHIKQALAQDYEVNDFDTIRLPYASLPELAMDDIDLSVNLFGKTFAYPFFINAMTGGTEKALFINKKLAQLAAYFHLPIATGSLSIALKDPTTAPTFQVIREVYPNGFVIANLGAHHDQYRAEKAVNVLKANALQIHLNAPQELAMPEGDRNFKGWSDNIVKIINHVKVPVIVKEVGYGMSKQTIQTLIHLGVQYIDVAGKGGTNFSMIENARRDKGLLGLNEVGYSTVESLQFARAHQGTTFIASGGIHRASDIVKALYLGASFVGLSGYFLKLAHTYEVEEMIQEVERLIEEIKALVLLTGSKNIKELGALYEHR
jgi:isopentenyl-diphosphate delta-isomerase